jgi:hypothetical protein
MESLEIWIKHLKPVWKKDGLLMKKAMIECYEECEDLGYVRKGTAEEMKFFLF